MIQFKMLKNKKQKQKQKFKITKKLTTGQFKKI